MAADHSRKQAAPSRWEPNFKARTQNPIDEQIVTAIFVRTYLEHLPPRAREVIDLEFIQEQSIADIAGRLGLTQGAVRMAKARGINRLREKLIRDAKILEENLKP